MKYGSTLKSVLIHRISKKGADRLSDPIIDEERLRLIINNEKAFELVFTMTHIRALAAGFLFTQGIARKPSDLVSLSLAPDGRECEITLSQDAFNRFRRMNQSLPVKGSSGGRMPSFAQVSGTDSPSLALKITAAQVLFLIEQHAAHSTLFKETGAVHSAGLCSCDTILDYFEDIGRHNAVDKLAGHLFLNPAPVAERIVTLSCRMSVEIISKIIQTRIKIVISNAAPTLSAVRLADQAGVTMIGFARQGRFNIYTHPERVITN